MLISSIWRPKWVWVVEPPLFCAPQSLMVARICGAGAWLHVQDFEVDAAYDLGLLRSGRRFVEAIERWILSRFNRVSSISDQMLDRLRKKGVREERIRKFHNWADLEAIRYLPEQGAAFRRELDIPPTSVVALYSGNMGAKQGLEVLSGVARELAQSDSDVVFVFCGSGAGKEALVRDCADLLNVRFLPLQPIDRLCELLNMADIHLLPQRADAADLVMPSKLTGMLASGRPVVAGTKIGTALAVAIEGCGIAVEPENPCAMATAIRKLADNPEFRRRLGRIARQYAEDRLGKEKVLIEFESEISGAAS
jgi:colanic acid biosynthesis glycosyl transferase WcaI